MNQKRPPDPQPARDALSSAPEARQRRPSRSDGQTAQRWALGGVAAFGLAALFTLAGCPANLDQPERFASGGSPDPDALPACMTAMFAHSCAGGSCHDKGTFTNDLDLISPGVKARIVDVAAAHSGLGDAAVSCMPAKLVDTQDGLKSWLYIKLTGMQGDTTTCGFSMPLASTVNESEKACYTEYFQTLGGSAGGTGGAATGGGAGTASGSGGTGGAATGGGGGTGGAATGGGGSGGAAPSGGSGGSGGASGGASGSAGTGGA